MRYSPTLLAKAFLVVSHKTPQNKDGQIIKNFLNVAAKYGGASYLKKTMGEIERLARQERGLKQISINSARPLPRKLVTAITSNFHKNDEVRESISPELIAGIKIVIDNELSIDNTLKRKLETLFANH